MDTTPTHPDQYCVHPVPNQQVSGLLSTGVKRRVADVRKNKETNTNKYRKKGRGHNKET
jgi:hypothetical protein